MENATQALFMAAGVLIAVLIISLSIFLFSSASKVSENYDMKMSESEILKFNSQFTKYITNNVEPEDKYKVLKYTSYNVAADVVSVINLAYNLNESNDCDLNRGIQVVINNVELAKGTGKYGITPLVQNHYKTQKIKDKNAIYLLKNDKKEDYNNFSSYNKDSLCHINTLLEKYSECAYYKLAENDKLYKIYHYYFSCEVNTNENTGLVDEVIFTCINNIDNYNNANNF